MTLVISTCPLLLRFKIAYYLWKSGNLDFSLTSLLWASVFMETSYYTQSVAVWGSYDNWATNWPNDMATLVSQNTT